MYYIKNSCGCGGKMTKFIGKWTIDWLKFEKRGGGTENIDKLVLAKDWFNKELVDDFSATIDENRKPTGNYLRIIPFGNNEKELNSIIQDGDIILCMGTQPPETLFKQRGWHAEICYKSPEGVAYVTGVNGNREIRIAKCDAGDADWTAHIYRVIYPEHAYDPVQLTKLKQQIYIWSQIYNKIRFPDDYNSDPADFVSVPDLKEAATKLIHRSKDSTPDLPYVTCVQWAYEILCLSLCVPLSSKKLIENGLYKDFIENWPDLESKLSDDSLEGVDKLPFVPYTTAEAIQASLDTYAYRYPLLDLLEKQEERESLVNHFISAQINRELISTYFCDVLESKNIKIPMLINGKPYHMIYPSMFYCEARNANLKKPDEPWIQYIGTMLPKEYVKEI
jgi:hypothetical protein